MFKFNHSSEGTSWASKEKTASGSQTRLKGGAGPNTNSSSAGTFPSVRGKDEANYKKSFNGGN